MNGLVATRRDIAAIEASNDTPEMVISTWALSEVIEAASRTQNTEIGERALTRLEEKTQGSEAAWAFGILARGRALLSDDDEAEPLYRQSIARLAGTRLRPDLARSRLLYGEWLRRANRRSYAGSSCGSHTRRSSRWALTRSPTAPVTSFSPPVRRCAAAEMTRATPTHQEEHIARLARDGLTNPEIGAQLFLSPRTVEWHLRKVFTKLGISSRRGLRDALPSPGREATPA